MRLFDIISSGKWRTTISAGHSLLPPAKKIDLLPNDDFDIKRLSVECSDI
ncbi:hypothetical protein [Ferruginibacter sp.]|nr:hypothetical protein [Ferruginibacter sp.]